MDIFLGSWYFFCLRLILVRFKRAHRRISLALALFISFAQQIQFWERLLDPWLKRIIKIIIQFYPTTLDSERDKETGISWTPTPPRHPHVLRYVLHGLTSLISEQQPTKTPKTPYTQVDPHGPAWISSILHWPNAENSHSHCSNPAWYPNFHDTNHSVHNAGHRNAYPQNRPWSSYSLSAFAQYQAWSSPVVRPDPTQSMTKVGMS